jgi:hypothetical protein
MDHFLDKWSAVFRDYTPRTGTEEEGWVQRLAYSWIAYGTAVLQGGEPLAIPQSRPTTTDWTTLWSNVSPGPWLIDIVTMLMPEMGLPDGILTEAAGHDALKLPDFVKRNWQAVVRQRAERLAEIAKRDPDLSNRLRAKGLPAPLLPGKLGASLLPSLDFVTILASGKDAPEQSDPEPRASPPEAAAPRKTPRKKMVHEA